MKTSIPNQIEIEAQHFLMEYFQEAPDIAFTVSKADHLTKKFDEIRAFIGEKDITLQYNMVKEKLKEAITINDNDNEVLYWSYQLEDILYRSYHPKYPCYDLCGSWVYPTIEEAKDYMVVEVNIDHPNNFD